MIDSSRFGGIRFPVPRRVINVSAGVLENTFLLLLVHKKISLKI